MPRRDGMGPTGMGPMTGWGTGYCGGGYGTGRYPGRGRGFRRSAGFCPPPVGWGMGYQVNREDALQQQKEILEQQIRMIDEELKGAQKED